MAQTILVVDDEPKLRQLLRIYLLQEGYQVVEAANGREALEVARAAKPELIVLDVMMPEMTGLEFMRAFRKESQTPVIMLSARVEEQDTIIALDLGADEYVTKPFGIKALMARIRALLRRTQRQPPEPEPLRLSDALDRTDVSVQIGDVTISGIGYRFKKP